MDLLTTQLPLIGRKLRTSTQEPGFQESYETVANAAQTGKKPFAWIDEFMCPRNLDIWDGGLENYIQP